MTPPPRQPSGWWTFSSVLPCAARSCRTAGQCGTLHEASPSSEPAQRERLSRHCRRRPLAAELEQSHPATASSARDAVLAGKPGWDPSPGRRMCGVASPPHHHRSPRHCCAGTFAQPVETPQPCREDDVSVTATSSAHLQRMLSRRCQMSLSLSRCPTQSLSLHRILARHSRR